MAFNLRAPDIYVEEVSGGVRPIEGVGTATLGVVGTAPIPDARLGEAVPINNWSDFERIYIPEQNPTSTPLASAVYGFFANGGGRCYVVNVPAGEPIRGGERPRSGLRLLEAVDEVAIVAAPGYTDVLSYEALLEHCETLQDRVAILDAPRDVDNPDRLTRVATERSSGRRAARSSSAEGDPPAEDAEPSAEDDGLGPRRSKQAALYFPWLRAYDPVTGQIVDTPPSGHMAGVWARNDATRGVHKAPANEPIAGGVVDLTYRVTRGEQEVLNPKGVNCIRFFTTEGIRIWGARTLSDDPEWRYLNVRRLFNMLKESIAEGTRWIVFEPNDPVLWGSIRRDITDFLTRVWRDGALFGATPQQAFFVKCDEETNPPEARDAGYVVVRIGVAPVKPAEFVVFELSQSMGGTTEIVGG